MLRRQNSIPIIAKMADFDKSTSNDRRVPSVPMPITKPLEYDELFGEDGKPRISVVRRHLTGEGRLTKEQLIIILDMATELLYDEPNMLEIDGPITSMFCWWFDGLLFLC